MAKNGFRVMDSDMHIVEPLGLWRRYIDPSYRDQAPRGLNRHFRDLGVEVAGRVFPAPNRSYPNAITPVMALGDPEPSIKLLGNSVPPIHWRFCDNSSRDGVM